MKKLHNKPVNDDIFAPKEGQGGSLCSNKESFPCPSLGVRAEPLSKETVDALEELGSVLKDISKRMILEGHEIINGVIRKKTYDQS